MEKITSVDNAQVKKWNKLHQKKERDATGLFLVEGKHLIEEALKYNAVELVLYEKECPFQNVDSQEVSKNVLDKLSSNPSGADYIGICHLPKLELKKKERILLLDGIQDPGNLGTLIRTAISFSFDGIYCSKDTCDYLNEKVIRSTQGAIFQIPIFYVDLIECIKELKEENVQVIATTLQDAKTMKEIPPQEKMAFILGNEGNGVSKEVSACADTHLRIEMEGFESLNVAVAGGIILYHYRKEV